MKSERRHELEHNTLDTEISKTIGFLKKNLNRILTVVLVVLVVIVGWTWWNKNQAKKAWDSQRQYDQLYGQINPDNPDAATRGKLINSFLRLSMESSSPRIAANSLLQTATLYSLEGLSSNDGDAQKTAYAQAESYYKRIVSECGEFPFIVAGAKIGLGKLAETRNDIPEARRRYQSAIDTPGIDGYPVKTLAEAALQETDGFNGNVKLAKKLPAWAQAEGPSPGRAKKEAAAAKKTPAKDTTR